MDFDMGSSSTLNVTAQSREDELYFQNLAAKRGELGGLESLLPNTQTARRIQVGTPPLGSPWIAQTPKSVPTNESIQKLMEAAQVAIAKPIEPVEVVNPKELAGSRKPAVWSVMPRWIVLLVGRVMAVGAAKYGAFNYRDSSISASTYQDAMERHGQLWFDGEDNDPETGVSHLASIMASCALLLDAQATGKLDDDRQKTGLARKTLDELEGLLKSHPMPTRH